MTVYDLKESGKSYEEIYEELKKSVVQEDVNMEKPA